MDTISQRMKVALTARNMKQADLVELTGIGKSSISTYISGEYEPKQKNIYKIAKALNVSEAWLLGFDVAMDRIDSKTTHFSDKQQRLVDAYEAHPEMQTAVNQLLGITDNAIPLKFEPKRHEIDSAHIPGKVTINPLAARSVDDHAPAAREVDAELFEKMKRTPTKKSDSEL